MAVVVVVFEDVDELFSLPVDWVFLLVGLDPRRLVIAILKLFIALVGKSIRLGAAHGNG
jgi:hypothetical protein